MPSASSPHLLLLAAGQGQRVGEAIPKQYLTDRRGVTILEHTLRRAVDSLAWQSIVVAAPTQDVERTQALLDGVTSAPLLVVAGAPDRMDSLRNALAVVPDDPEAICVMHDGVRPCTPPALFSSVVERLQAADADACWPASALRDTLLERTSDMAWQVVPPSRSLVAATPIAVRRGALDRALASDDAIASSILIDRLTRIGARWTSVENSSWNFKVTTPDDVTLARALVDSERAQRRSAK